MIQTNTLILNTLSTTKTEPCWRLIYDDNKRIHFYGETGGDTFTIHHLFAGTRAECDAKITELALVPTEGGYEVPEKESILTVMEARKEELKWIAINAIKENHTLTLAEFLATLNWEDQNLASIMIYGYATEAAKKGILTLPNTNPDTCWAVLTGFVISSTDEQIHDILG